MKAIITVGVSASGKSTWAKEYAKANKAIISNRDDLRFSLTGSSGWDEYRFNGKIEKLVTSMQMNLLTHNHTLIRRDVVIADTNLNHDSRARLIKACAGIGYEVEVLAFPISLEDAIDRDWRRCGSRVGSSVIELQYKTWLEFLKEHRGNI